MIGVAVSALAFTLFAGFAEKRRSRRRQLDDVGFMPWPLLSLLGSVVTLFAVALSIKYH
jgi:hypothetical protein